MPYIYVCDHTPIATAHGSGWILIAVDYTTHSYVVDFGRTARTFICFGAHSNLNVLLLGYDDHNCYMQPHSNGDGSRLRIDIDFGGIYDTLLC